MHIISLTFFVSVKNSFENVTGWILYYVFFFSDEEPKKKVGGKFEGDFFKHFYQEQGDYSQAEKIEEEEEKKAKDAKKKKTGKKSHKGHPKKPQ